MRPDAGAGRRGGGLVKFGGGGTGIGGAGIGSGPAAQAVIRQHAIVNRCNRFTGSLLDEGVKGAVNLGTEHLACAAYLGALGNDHLSCGCRLLLALHHGRAGARLAACGSHIHTMRITAQGGGHECQQTQRHSPAEQPGVGREKTQEHEPKPQRR